MFNIKSKTILIVMLLSISSITSSQELNNKLGKEIAVKGNSKGATACISCHGAQGKGIAAAGFPRLNNLNQYYIIKQLQDFSNGSRKNSIMGPIAKALTTKQTSAVAAYFTNLKSASSKSTKISASTLKLGEQLATIGNWSRNIPACSACHGRGGYGIGKHFPTLAGQHASYIKQQIQAWKSGTRKNDSNDLMKVVAQRLSKKEIKAVSAYFSSLPAVKK